MSEGNDLQAGEVADSPCVGVCRLDADGAICVGCYRTLGEIGQWTAVNAGQRAAIVDAAAERRRQAEQ